MLNIKTMNAISATYKKYLPKDEYKVSADIENPDGILVRSADMHKYDMPEALLAIARAGAGVNNIPVDDCAKKGIVVFNTPGANANAVKELAIAAMLIGSRDVVGGVDWARTLEGQGDQVPKLVEKGKSQFVGPELMGKKLGVIGLGEIGVLVANAAKAMDMVVQGYDPYISVEHAWKLSRSIVQMKTLDEILSKSDYVTLHLPLMDKTRGMINAETISKMRKGATLINLARGELVNNDDILAALESGHLRAYVTDFPCEALINKKGVICIPHLGASTPESEDNCVVMACKEISAYLKAGVIKNSVNYPDCELPELIKRRLCILHENVAGMVTKITSLVAGLGINIDSMVNKSKGAYAYTVLDLDEDFSGHLVSDIEQMPEVYKVRFF